MPVPRDVMLPPVPPSDMVPGVLYDDPVHLAGYVGYFAIDRDRELAYRVMAKQDRLTPEMYAHFEQAARLACGVTKPPLSLLG